MERLEAAFKVVEGRLSVPDDSGLFGEIQSTLRIVVVLGPRANDVCVWERFSRRFSSAVGISLTVHRSRNRHRPGCTRVNVA